VEQSQKSIFTPQYLHLHFVTQLFSPRENKCVTQRLDAEGNLSKEYEVQNCLLGKDAHCIAELCIGSILLAAGNNFFSFVAIIS